jgi:hypothetical protein
MGQDGYEKKRAARVAEARRTGKLRCRGCGKDKALGEFRWEKLRRASGGEYTAVPTRCRLCIRLYREGWRRTRDEESLDRERLQRRAVNRAVQRRRYERDKDVNSRWNRENAAKVKVRRFLLNELRTGRLKRPRKCSRCPRGAKRGFSRIAGWFPPGKPVARESVVWLCYPCLWRAKHPEGDEDAAMEREARAAARARALVRRLVAVRDDYEVSLKSAPWFPRRVERHQLLRGLTPPSREFHEALHRENVARLAAEAEDVARDARKHGPCHARLWGLYSDVESPREREREVREAQERQQRATT